MPDYRYTVVNRAGQQDVGSCHAFSVQSLKAELESRGLLVLNIQESGRINRTWLLNYRVKKQQLHLLIQEFIAYLKARMTLPEILDNLSRRSSQPRLAAALGRIRQEVEGGSSLSASMARFPDLFDSYLVASVQMGEKRGQLQKSLVDYREYLAGRIALEEKIRAALVYPLFLSLILVASLGVLFVFVLPKFSNMYAEFEAPLPLATQLLMRVVDAMDILLPLGLLALVGLFYGGRRLQQRPEVRAAIDRAWLRLPVLRELVMAFHTAHTARNISALLQMGMPLVEAIENVAATSRNSAIAQRLVAVTKRLREGQGLAASLEAEGLFDPSAWSLIGAGERAGDLHAALETVAEYNQQRLGQGVNRYLSLVEPLFMLLVGIIIGGIIFMMYLPIFGIVEAIH